MRARSQKAQITFCVRGVISPVLSNVYLNEVDKMLEKAIETTQRGQYPQIQYARFADDLLILISSHPQQDLGGEGGGKATAGGIGQTQSGDQRRKDPDGQSIEGRKLRVSWI